jgi:hypothetical protein
MRNHLRLVGRDELFEEAHRLRSYDSRTNGRARCLCGAHSEWGRVSKADRLDWHETHKDEARSALFARLSQR